MISIAYNRYLWLVNTLLSFKKLSFQEISNKWSSSYLSENQSLSRRTFHAHKQAIEEMFGICIECDAADGYKYYISNCSNIEKDKARKWILNSFNVNNLVNEGQSIKERLILEDIPKGTEFLSVIIDSIKKNKVLEIEYKPFYEDKVSIYHICPYCLRVLNQRWYVLGFMKEKESLRHISLDRVINIIQTNETFKYPKDFSPDEYYSESFGIWVDERLKPEKVIIRAYGQQSKYIETLPFHHSQKIVQRGENYTDFSYYIRISHDFVRELMSKCGDIEVLLPEHLRNIIQQQALSILKRYSKTKKYNS